MKLSLYSEFNNSTYHVVPVCANFTIIKKNASIFHIHPVYHIMSITEGTGYIEYNGRKYPVKPGNILLINPDKTHILYAENNKFYKYYSFNFMLVKNQLFKKQNQHSLFDITDRKKINQLNKLAETEDLETLFAFKTDGVYIVYNTSNWNIINSLIKSFNEKITKFQLENFFCSGKNSESYLDIEYSNSFTKFLFDILNIIADRKNIGEDILLKNIIGHLKKNIYNNFSLKKLSEETRYNKSYLCTYFKMKTGTTINRFYNKLKINEAANKLKETDCSIGEIALMLNFCTPNHFSTVFKNEKNITPKEYRKVIKYQ